MSPDTTGLFPNIVKNYQPNKFPVDAEYFFYCKLRMLYHYAVKNKNYDFAYNKYIEILNSSSKDSIYNSLISLHGAYNLIDYVNTNPNEVARYKGIPMRFRYNPQIRTLMKTGKYRIRYRGCSKPQYGYVRSQYNCLAEYADTFAIYPK